MISYVLAVIFVVLALTFYLYYYSQNFDCQNQINPWCWTDWQCKIGTLPAQDLYGCYPGVKRDADYCTNSANFGADGSPPRGCQCMPVNGVFPSACQFNWNPADGNGLQCYAQALNSITDNNPVNLITRCGTGASTS